MLRPKPPSANLASAVAAMPKPATPAAKAWGGGPKMVSPAASPWQDKSKPPVAASPAVLAAQAKKEAEMAKRQEELKNRRDKEDEKRNMHQAAFTVRKVIHRLRVAQPENFDELVQELEKVQMENLEAMGDLAATVGEEAERSLAIAEKRFKEVEEKKIAKEQAENEKKKKAEEEVERIGNIILEATQEVEEVESKASEAADEHALLSDAGKEADPAAILEMCTKTEDAITAAKDVYKTALGSLKQKREEVAKARGIKEASAITAQLIELQKRLTASQHPIAKMPEAIKAAKEVAQRKTLALKKEQDLKAAFSKHDTDGDGKLNKAEVAAFAEKEYGFTLETAALEKILGKIPGGKDGVGPEKLQQLRSMISMEKSLMKSRIAKVEEVERERVRKIEEETMLKEREEKKAVVQATLAEVASKTSSATEIVSKARKMSVELASGSEDLSASRIVEVANEIERDASSAKTLFESVGESLSALEGQEEKDKVLKGFITAEVQKKERLIKNLREQLAKVTAQAKEARASCARKQYSEMETYRLTLVPAVLALMKNTGKTGLELFKASAKNKGDMGAEEFVALLTSLTDKALPDAVRPDSIDDSLAEELFTHVAAGSDVISEDKFVFSMTAINYRVVKSTAITEEQAITSKCHRKLEPGDVLEVFEGPVADTATGLERVRCKATQDGLEGWVTLAGNKGSVFLEPVGGYHICIKETSLADGQPVSAKTIRKISKGEMVQMLDVEQKDASCGVTRMKARMVKDGEVGWVTTMGNKNAVKFFELC